MLSHLFNLLYKARFQNILFRLKNFRGSFRYLALNAGLVSEHGIRLRKVIRNLWKPNDSMDSLRYYYYVTNNDMYCWKVSEQSNSWSRWVSNSRWINFQSINTVMSHLVSSLCKFLVNTNKFHFCIIYTNSLRILYHWVSTFKTCRVTWQWEATDHMLTNLITF